ncbi:probable polyamine oxidase 5 [Vigna radiata var. radiata]|uniref:Probable polyamine oxidase 5 n=1 Tax=Vigna radiata var. radiata TaxID=3916 RepID=A0A1S3UQQ9_VIGRR|nr:probable polyamine oxidase 5 [Vigna radiata var. radiata]
MAVKKARIVIVGAGMAGITAANRLHSVSASKNLFEVCVVEGGNRIGGRINTSEFGGDRIEMGATWIHGIEGSPIHKIAQQIHALESQQPWECMDGNDNKATTIAEGGFVLNPSFVHPITELFNNLMDHAQGKMSTATTKGESGILSIGSFLRQGLAAYWDSSKEEKELKGFGKWSRKLLDEAIFAMHENTQRTCTSVADLLTLDYDAESEYQMFPGEEITIGKGYSSIIESLASVLPPGSVQLGRKVTRIEWQPERQEAMNMENGTCSRPVVLHFSDGSIMSADHVIVTVSLGVLKASIRDNDSGMSMFHPPLPAFKVEAISRLGFGVVNKLFMQLSPPHGGFPFLQMVFHSPNSELRQKKIPWWMRRTATLCPIYKNSSVLLSWFAGEEALALESLKDEEIIKGVSDTVSCFLSQSVEFCNGNVNSEKHSHEYKVKFSKVLKSQWGKDPLFLGSYSHVAVGSSGDDFDKMAEPLPKCSSSSQLSASPPLQILFAGEATHRTHYSTTHGAYFSGLREANRLIQHYSPC